jgi:hypothetical protein
MPPWMLKAAAQGVAALLPGADRVSLFVQDRVLKTLRMDERTAATKARRAFDHVASRAALSGPPATVLELGTGWFPVSPLALAVAGTRRVISVDNTSHVRPDHLHTSLALVVALAERGAFPADVARLATAHELLRARPGADSLLAALGVEAIVGDARKLPLDAGSVDLMFSNNTLEHIPGSVIADIFGDFARVAAPGAVMSHWIDMGDHYANFDPSIGVFHFLRYPERVWRLFNNSIHYQNRLRLSDFRDLHAETGWKIVREAPVRGTLEDLRKVPLAPEFRDHSEDDLLAYEATIVATR